ncbi:MAG: hypothetical protein LBE59_08180 [Nevskiaceae bacterium]|jgi:hypothetical protein|nr:hypothetical protein [Nevskiaceae bacterium]
MKTIPVRCALGVSMAVMLALSACNSDDVVQTTPPGTGGTTGGSTATDNTNTGNTGGSTTDSGNTGSTVDAGNAGSGAADDLVDADAVTFGRYLTGDFHNHTTCSDGSISMQKLVSKSADKKDTPWGLDWFVQAGHGGNGNRNCMLVEDPSLGTPVYPFVQGVGPNTTWADTIGAAAVLGNAANGTPLSDAANPSMWRWQSIQQYQYPLVEYLSALKKLPLFIGMESVAAGHEHTSMSVISGQVIPDKLKNPNATTYNPEGNATALAQWSYCFDRNDTDNSRGGGQQWSCTVPGSANEADADWNVTAAKLVPASGAGNGERGHLKTVEGLKWMAAYHPRESYYVPAHLERAGPFNPDGNNGFNIEHLRNFNNAAPEIAFGMETQPGHGASSSRGEYAIDRNSINGVRVDSVGGSTWGGTGVYGAHVGGVWDALLGEGRNWWFFASSDWHNRGSFSADDRRSTQDFLPGEYQRDFVLLPEKDTEARRRTQQVDPQQVVDGLRSGNSFTASGQLIDRLAFVVCVDPKKADVDDAAVEALVRAAALKAATENASANLTDLPCATMGGKLQVNKNDALIVGVALRDPEGTNYSPYTFSNPSLAQIGLEQPLNKPALHHVDVIGGLVTGYRAPGSLAYAGTWPDNWADNPDSSRLPAATVNTSTGILKTIDSSGWQNAAQKGFKTMIVRIEKATDSRYLRLRGTNLPASVPYETDANGNPLADVYTNADTPDRLAIRCTVEPSKPIPTGTAYTGAGIDGCPDHLARVPEVTGPKYVSYDVAAWADLWFYSNPVYVEVKGSTPIVGVK